MATYHKAGTDGKGGKVLYVYLSGGEVGYRAILRSRHFCLPLQVELLYACTIYIGTLCVCCCGLVYQLMEWYSMSREPHEPSHDLDRYFDPMMKY